MSNENSRITECPTAVAVIGNDMLNSLTLETYGAAVGTLLMVSRGINDSAARTVVSSGIGAEVRAVGDASARFTIAQQLAQAAGEIAKFFSPRPDAAH